MEGVVMRTVLILPLLAALTVQVQDKPLRPGETPQTVQNPKPAERQSLDRKIAAQFAPILYQGLGDNPRSDYITNFDFDGDWKGDNNWSNLENRSYPLRAYVYYSVAETATHYFIHYAIFHPRDYKGDLVKTAIIDVLINEGLRQIGKDPTGGLAGDLALSHENDLEGCLIVAEKKGEGLSQAVVRYVETMAHNQFLRYCAAAAAAGICESIEMKGQRPLIFIEPKGHGPIGYTGDRVQMKNSVNGVLTYSYTGNADDPDKINEKSVGYDLMPICDTLWLRAQQGDKETYGEVFNYQTRSLLKFQLGKPAGKVERKFGSLGAAFRGEVGSKNKARPPWAWFDDSERDRPRGEWFFDPASVIARHFNLGQEFSQAYVYHQYFKIGL
jgi:hypothetical protein